MAGKGSKPRPTNGEKYRSNYDEIFQKCKCSIGISCSKCPLRIKAPNKT